MAFEVDASQVDFGKLKKGETSTQQISVNNTGSQAVYVEAIVSGDSKLLDQFKLNSQLWSDYNQTIASKVTEQVTASLTIPNDFSGSGKHTGEVVFWGTVAK